MQIRTYGHPEFDALRNLWVAKITQMICDARPIKRKNPEQSLICNHKRAVAFLDNSEQFRLICGLIDLNPDWVLRKIKEGERDITGVFGWGDAYKRTCQKKRKRSKK